MGLGAEEQLGARLLANCGGMDKTWSDSREASEYVAYLLENNLHVLPGSKAVAEAVQWPVSNPVAQCARRQAEGQCYNRCFQADANK